MKRLITICAVVVLFSSGYARAEIYGGGSGSETDPYIINTPEQMNAIGVNSADWDKCFVQTADINLSAYTGTDFNLIGSSSPRFTGSFNGNGYTIKNFTYDADYYDYCGMFRYF
jgi:hypothetical protein